MAPTSTWPPLKWLATLLCTTAMLVACQRATPEPTYRYDDRELWKALPQLQVPFAGDTFTVHTVAQPTADGSHVFVWLGEPSTPNNGDALVMQHLARANPRSAVWYIDTPDALFMARDRVAMRNHNGDFVAPLLA
ncbi:MAG: hypothetical protein K2W33_05090, partial [Burkholderiales bacterium]|nr:hypothetical protein [Burkholderiales bacterium]